jgi:hypothetical protein
MKNRVLWTIQILLALLFLMAGGAKVFMPAEMLAKQAPMFPPVFLRFIGICEVLGAVGLILPWLLRVRPGLTPLAASGLVVIMIGAVSVMMITAGLAQALFPFAIGLLAAFVAYGRGRSPAAA